MELIYLFIYLCYVYDVPKIVSWFYGVVCTGTEGKHKHLLHKNNARYRHAFFFQILSYVPFFLLS